MRHVPKAIAPVLEELELRQPRLVSKKDLEAVSAKASPTAGVDYVLSRLLEQGWLLPLKTRGVWEFAPGARAGPVGSGDPLIELRATLLRRPALTVAVAAESAAWLHALTGRPPMRHVLAAPKTVDLPPALSEFRVLRHTPRLPLDTKNDLPTWRVASLLAAMAIRPSTYRDWPNAAEWLMEAFRLVSADELISELRTERRAAWARLGYLAASGHADDIAASILMTAPSGVGPYYLGRRDRPGRYDSRFGVVDSALQRTKP